MKTDTSANGLPRKMSANKLPRAEVQPRLPLIAKPLGGLDTLELEIMRDDLSPLVERIRSLPDRSLLAMLNDDPENYTPGALSIAEAEVEARGGLNDLIGGHSKSDLEIDGERYRKSTRTIDKLFTRLIGHVPSERYPGLSYVSIAMVVISFLLGTLALGGSILAVIALFGQGSFGWLVTTIGTLQAGVGALLLYGGSELIRVVLDIEENTRGESGEQKDSTDEQSLNPKE